MVTPIPLKILKTIDLALAAYTRTEPQPWFTASYDGDHKTGELIFTTPEGDFVLRSVDITQDSDHWVDDE